MTTFYFYLDTKPSELSQATEPNDLMVICLSALKESEQYENLSFLRQYKDTKPDSEKIKTIEQLEIEIHNLPPHDKLFGIFPLTYTQYYANGKGMAQTLIRHNIIKDMGKKYMWSKLGDPSFLLTKEKFIGLLAFTNALVQINLEIRLQKEKLEKIIGRVMKKIVFKLDNLPFDPEKFWEYCKILFPLSFQMETYRHQLKDGIESVIDRIDPVDKNTNSMKLADWITALSYNSILLDVDSNNPLLIKSKRFLDSFEKINST